MRPIDRRLIKACQSGNTRTIEKLLRQGANPNAQDDNHEPPIIIATKNGHIPIITLLIQYGANPNITDAYGKNLIHYATTYQHHDIAEYLITQLHLNPNTKDRWGLTPFLIATQKHDIKMLHILAQHGANPHVTDHQGRNALHYATADNQTDIIQYLLTQLHLDPNAQEDILGQTPFLISVHNRNIKLIQLLIQYGANPLITDKNGRIALHYAVEQGDYNIAESLITQLQLDPNTQDHQGITPFMLAAQNGDIHILKRLIQHGADPHIQDASDGTALHYAVETQNPTTTQYLLTQLQLDPNTQAHQGITPLMIAAERGDIDMIRLLIQHGADPHIQDDFGRTALHYAVKNQNYDIAQYLLTQLHINPNTQDNNGITPFMLATQNGDIKMLRLLAQLGANPNATDPKGQTALHYALEYQKHDIAQYFITELKLEPNTQDRRGRIPFLIAAKNGDIRILKLLIQHGADPYIRNTLGKSALHFAVEYQNYDIARYLLTQLQLDPNSQDHNGITPLIIAAQYGDIDMIRLLIQHGANPYATDHQGRNALHYAAEYGHPQAASFLIKHLHFDPNQQDHQGDTPLLIAFQKGYAYIARTLIQLGANPKIPNHQGQTPTSISNLITIQFKKQKQSTIIL